MKRKLLAALLAAVMLLGASGGALAEGAAADQALAAVTEKVKAALGLDTEAFDDFQGQVREDPLLGKRWSLAWSGDGSSLSVTADDGGKVYSYYRYDAADSAEVYVSSTRLQIPALPEDKSGAALETARDFLDRVLDDGTERVVLEDDTYPSLNRTSYRFSGTVLLNGLSSPISCSITVRASDLAVTRFWRSDENAGYLGAVPAAATSVTDAQARSLLRSTLEMEPEYVVGEDGKTARVRFLAVSGDEYYVDGATGALVDLSELERKLWQKSEGVVYGSAAQKNDAVAEMARDGAGGLTTAERDGAAKLAGAMSKEDLDRAVKNAWPEIGLDAYTLASADYSVVEKELPEGQERASEDYDVTCRLTYGKRSGTETANKYLTVDAKTGALKRLQSSRYDAEEPNKTYSCSVSATQGQAKAEAVLKSFAGESFNALALFETLDGKTEKSWRHTYTFSQKANGYFYHGNSYTVGIDATDGTVSALSGSFDQDVVLVVPDRVIDPVSAAAAYADALELSYGYLEVPTSVSLAGSQVAPLLKEAGYEYVTALKTGFVLRQPEDGFVSGVDAETGEAVAEKNDPEESGDVAYDDLEGVWVKEAAQALAAFRIGFGGGSLRPDQPLTQLDMVALLCSVDGYFYDPDATKEDTDRLYRRAYSLGLVTPDARQEDKSVTRGELVRLILDGAGYGRIAALEGIFRCDFTDQSSIPADQLGYAALAQGLGMVKGGSDGAYAGERTATRAEAVAMLYQYMK